MAEDLALLVVVIEWQIQFDIDNESGYGSEHESKGKHSADPPSKFGPTVSAFTYKSSLALWAVT
jgi:hypothetical protein